MLSGTLSFNGEDVFVGFLGGACNLAGTLLLLEGYRRGKVGVVTGMAATYILIPLAYSFLIGELISPIMAVGVAVLFLGMATFYAGSMRDQSQQSSPTPVRQHDRSENRNDVDADNGQHQRIATSCTQKVDRQHRHPQCRTGMRTLCSRVADNAPCRTD